MFSRGLFFLILASAPVIGFPASFIPLGELPGGIFRSQAADVSNDGTTVVGSNFDVMPIDQAIRWTSSTGMVGLGYLPSGGYSDARGVSADGMVVVGVSQTATGQQAFRWTAAGGMSALGDLPGGQDSSTADAVSADGNVVVGQSRGASDSIEAIRWTSTTGISGLGFLAGGSYSRADGVSGDGSVIVGLSQTLDSEEAFQWTMLNGLVGLGFLPGGSSSSALGVSDDGKFVVGRADRGPGQQEAFRWTSTGGMVGLGDLAGGDFSSTAFDASGDGSVVVGTGYTSDGIEGFIWTEAGGMQRIFDVLVTGGAAGLAGWTSLAATSISADGITVAGTGINPNGQVEAFMATLTPVPLPGTLVLLAPALALLAAARRRGVGTV